MQWEIEECYRDLAGSRYDGQHYGEEVEMAYAERAAERAERQRSAIRAEWVAAYCDELNEWARATGRVRAA